MNLLTRMFFGNPLSAWLVALGAAIAAFGLLRLAKRGFSRRLAALARRTETEVDDLLTELLGKTRGFTLLGISMFVGSQFLAKSPSLESVLRAGLVLVLLLQGALWSIQAVAFIQGRMILKRQDDPSGAAAVAAAGFAARLVLGSVFLLMALDNLGVNITGLVAGLGIGGVAIALAVQNILGDLFASLSIVLDKPFAIGDFLIVGDFLGTVEHIGLKTTRLHSLSGEQIVFSNGDLLKSRIRNFKQMVERRVVFSLGVTYQTAHDKLAAISGLVRQIVESQPAVRFDRAQFKEFGDSALVFEVVYYLLDPDYTLYMDTQHAINLAIYHRFEVEGIAFAYPTRTLFLAKEPGLPLHTFEGLSI